MKRWQLHGCQGPGSLHLAALESSAADHEPVWLLELQLLYLRSRQQGGEREELFETLHIKCVYILLARTLLYAMCSLQKSVGNAVS